MLTIPPDCLLLSYNVNFKTSTIIFMVTMQFFCVSFGYNKFILVPDRCGFGSSMKWGIEWVGNLLGGERRVRVRRYAQGNHNESYNLLLSASRC